MERAARRREEGDVTPTGRHRSSFMFWKQNKSNQDDYGNSNICLLQTKRKITKRKLNTIQLILSRQSKNISEKLGVSVQKICSRVRSPMCIMDMDILGVVVVRTVEPGLSIRSHNNGYKTCGHFCGIFKITLLTGYKKNQLSVVLLYENQQQFGETITPISTKLVEYDTITH